MPRVHVEVPGRESELVELRDGEGVVFGRAPDASKVEDVGASFREHALLVPSVSSNHVAVWSRERVASVRDLSSRNGTWLRLPRGEVVHLGSDADVQLRIAIRSGAPAADQSIEPPHYNEESEFGAGIARAVQGWLANHEMRVRAIATREAPASGIVLPLASGEVLTLLVEHTVDEHFHTLMLPVARYVAAQNAIYVAERETREDGMILASAAIRQVHRRVVEAAIQNTSRLLLLGPSGTGKERLARAYHRHLGCSGPLVTVNCATLTRERIVADLFGAEAGAYTGAQRVVVGAVERADGGTLFLDEIGEMPLDVQSQLLRFLDTGEYQRLGATGLSRTATVNVVAATNRDLRTMVNEGSFRLDLYYRIALEIIEVPSLRERFKDAIAYLSSQPLDATTAHDALEPAALEVLRQHPWPGNFRELVNFVKRLPRKGTVGSIDAETARRILGSTALSPSAPLPVITDGPPGDWLTWVRASAAAYCNEHGEHGPTSWSEMTTFIEQYLKPYALVHMAGVAEASDPQSITPSRVAETVKADRGTVIKQIRRYFESRK